MKEFLESLESFVSPLGTLGAAIIVGLVGYFLLFKIVERLSRSTETILDDLLVKHCRGPSRLILPLLAFHFFLPLVKAPSGILTFLTQVFSSLLIVSMAWLVIKLTSVLEDFLLKQYRIDVRDNLMARRIHTQIQVLWDLRRLIVPITYFLERPFQNWTRVSADLLGTVFIYVDYTVPVQAVREELRRILENSTQWDGQVCALQVTNTTEHTMELRALMSAPDSSSAWELRCHVREKLVEFIQRNYPESLPKLRTDLKQPFFSPQ